MPSNLQERYQQVKQQFAGWMAQGQPRVTQTPPPTTPKPQLPFMAIGVDKKEEPYYAKLNGFANWTRRTFARIFDPKFFVPEPTKEEQYYMDQYEKGWSTFLNEKFAWDKWAEPFFGIKAEEVAQAGSAFSVSVMKTPENVEPGKPVEYKPSMGKALNQLTGLTNRTLMQSVWSVLDVFGVGDQLVRRTIHPARLTLDYYADASTLPDMPAWMNVLSFPNDLYDIYRVGNALRTGRLSAQELLSGVEKTFYMNQRAANMAYTLMFNEQRKAEFYRRYQAGESAQMLSQEIANPWIELGGSVVGDPLTYLGLGLPAKGGKIFGIGASADDIARSTRPLIRIGSKEIGRTAWSIKQITPSLGELLNLTVGKGRLLKETDDLVDLSPDMKRAFMSLGDNLDDADALRMVNKAADEAKAYVTSKKIEYGIASYTASARSQLLSRDASYFMQTFFSNGDVDEGLEILDAGVNLIKGDEAARNLAVRKLMNTTYGSIPLSPGALRTYAIMAEMKQAGNVDKIIDSMRAYRMMKNAERAGQVLEDGDLLKLAKWYEKNVGDDNSKLIDLLVKDLDEITTAMIPSVSDMGRAADEVKAARKAGTLDQVKPATQRLADAYAQVPWYARGANAYNESAGEVHRRIQAMFNGIFINWGSPAYPMRNVVQQGTVAALDGIPYNYTVEASVNMWSNRLTDNVVTQYYDDAKNMLGHVPEGMRRGTSGAAEIVTDTKKGLTLREEITKGYGQVAANADHMQGAAIIKHTVQEQIMNGLRSGGIPPVDGLVAAGFTKEDIGLIYNLVLDNYGWGNRVEKQFKKIAATGSMDTWRYLRPNSTLATAWNNLDLPADLHLSYQEVMGRKTQAEFDEAIEKILAIQRSRISQAAQDAAGLSPEIHPVAQEVVAHAQEHAGEFLADDEANLFSRMFQKRQELREAVIPASRNLQGIIDPNLTPDLRRAFTKELSDADLVSSRAFEQYRGLQDQLQDIKRALWRDDADLIELWNTRVLKNDGTTLWSMAEYYPGVPIPSSKREFSDMMWRSYYDTTGKFWDLANKKYLDDTLDIFRRYSQQAGMDFDVIARQAHPNQLNLIEELYRISREGDEISALWNRTRQFRAADFPTDASLLHLQIPDSQRLGFSDKTVRLGIFEEVNRRRRLENLPRYAHYEDVPIKEAVAAWTRMTPTDRLKLIQSLGDIDLWTVEHDLQKSIVAAEQVNPGVAEAVTHLNTNPPPYIPGSQSTTGQGTAQTYEGFSRDLQGFAGEVRSRWGVTAPTSTNLTPEKEEALRVWRSGWTDSRGRHVAGLDERAAMVRLKSEIYGNKMRDFILHDYLKTYGDVAAAYLMPYQYWYNRTYSKFIERILYDPRIASLYSKYRDFMASEHAGLPEWWKYNVPITFLPGTSAENPLMFNLEATLNPLNGITGVDFDDPYKRVDWLSSTLDDLNKFGPSMFTPIQWAVAYHLYKKGERDAAERWVGRLFPSQTKFIKSALNIPIGGTTGVEALGLQNFAEGTPISGVRYGEFDPFVNLFMNGQDPYEQRATRRALGAMVQDGSTTEEAAIDAAYANQGEVWDAARNRLEQERAPGTLFSFFLGVGYKPRTKEDLAIDRFYQEYSQLIGLRETMSPDEYRRSWDGLRAKYPFMDVVLIGGKAEDDKMAAYSYNVLSRIPPGQMTQLAEAAGLNKEMVNMFYDDKGSFENWTPGDVQRWNAGIVEIGAMMKMPDYPMRQEWTNAKLAYDDMKELAMATFGDGIYDTLDAYYDKEEGLERREFLAQHQELKALLSWTDEYVASNTLLNKYYGGIETIERVYSNMMYADLTKKYGSDIGEKWAYYRMLNSTNPKEASRYYRAHPELKQYSTDKAEWEDLINRTYVSIAGQLPQPEFPIREGFVPTSMNQQAIAAAAQPEPQITWGEFQQFFTMSNASYIIPLVQAYWLSGTPLSYNAKEELDYYSQQLGFNDGNALLRAIGRSLTTQP